MWVDFYGVEVGFVLDASSDVFGEGAGTGAKLKDGLTEVAFAKDGLGEPRGARDDAAGGQRGCEEALKKCQIGHRLGV